MQMLEIGRLATEEVTLIKRKSKAEKAEYLAAVTLSNVRVTPAKIASNNGGYDEVLNGKKLHYIVGHSTGDIDGVNKGSKVIHEGTEYLVKDVIQRRMPDNKIIQVILC